MGRTHYNTRKRKNTNTSKTVILTLKRKEKIRQFKARADHNIVEFGSVASPKWRNMLLAFMTVEDSDVTEEVIERWLKNHAWISEFSDGPRTHNESSPIRLALKTQVPKPPVKKVTFQSPGGKPLPNMRTVLSEINNGSPHESQQPPMAQEHNTHDQIISDARAHMEALHEGFLYRTVCPTCRQHGRNQLQTLITDAQTQSNILQEILQSLPGFTHPSTGTANEHNQSAGFRPMQLIDPVVRAVSSVEQRLFHLTN